MNYAYALFLIGSCLISTPFIARQIDKLRNNTHQAYSWVSGLIYFSFYLGIFLYFLSFLFVVRNF